VWGKRSQMARLLQWIFKHSATEALDL